MPPVMVSSKWKQTSRRPCPRCPFPPELYRSIIEWVTNAEDLYNLSLTSRICRAETERILYHKIDLPPNTRTPVLWATTILHHPHKALAVRSLTLRFDLSFLIVPHMLLSSLRLISQALGALRNLKELFLIGHPSVMMHSIHLWLLDGCTPSIEVFQNSLFHPSDIIPFLSRHPNIRQWKQMGVHPERTVEPTFLPHLTDLEVHSSVLSSFNTPRPLVRLCLMMGGPCGAEREREREIIKSLALFGSTLEVLNIWYCSTLNPDHLTMSELLSLLAEATPNLKMLAYNNAGPVSPQVSCYRPK